MQVRAAVAQQARQAASLLESQLHEFNGGLELPGTLAGLTQELAALADARRCVRCMQVRHRPCALRCIREHWS